MTTFNQWFATSGKQLDGAARLAFESVWNSMVNDRCSGNEAAALLTDLVHSLPQVELADEEDW